MLTPISPVLTCLLLSAALWLPACKGTRQEPPAADTSGAAPLLPGGQPAIAYAAAQISDYVVEIYEDSKGHLWFGTISHGAARYDGQSLTYFSVADGLCDPTVTCIMEDQAGNYWFGTHGGASRWDGKTWTTFAADQGLTGGGCKLLLDRQGRLWAGTDRGAFRFDGRGFVPFDLPVPKPAPDPLPYKVAPGKVWRILEDSHGAIWFARDGYGACRYDGRGFTSYTEADGLASSNVSEIVEDQQGHLWFGSLSSDYPKETRQGGLSRYDGKTFTRFPELDGLHDQDLYTIYNDRAGAVWISALRLGLYRYKDGEFTLYKQIDRPDLVPSFGIQAMLEDSRGRLWLGFSGGLFRFEDGAMHNVTQAGPWD